MRPRKSPANEGNSASSVLFVPEGVNGVAEKS